MAIKLLRNSSFALMRTNPKLTTNIKVVADSKDRIFLESFDANSELSRSKFKSFRVSNKSTYDYDVSRFYNKGKTPSDLIYDIGRESSDIQIHDKFSEQFEFNYSYGATSINSKTYSEEFGILAPIWLEKTIPDYFIVFRIDGPVSVNNINVDSENENASFIEDPKNFMDIILKNSKIIKTFNLTEDSEQGKYLRNYKKSERFPNSPFILSTEREKYSQWQGIDVKNGGFVNKGEFIYNELFAVDSTIIEDEYFLTQGFERNKMAIANIMNMQFLFDDNDVKDFTINRYFGLYVNAIDEGSFQVSGESLFKNKSYNQTPYPINSDYITPENTKSFLQYNKSGIIIPASNDTIDSKYITGDIDGDLLPDLFDKDFMPTHEDVEELTSIFYIKDKEDKFYNLKSGSNWKNGEEVRLQEEHIDWKNFTGSKMPILTTKGFNCKYDKGRASTFLTINNQIPHGDRYIAGIVNKQEYIFTVDNIVPGTIFNITDGINTLSVNAINYDPVNLFNDIKTAWLNSSFVNFNKFTISIKNNIITIIEKDTTGVDIDFQVSVSNNLSVFNVEKTISSSLESFTIIADNTLVIKPGKAIGRFFKPEGTNEEIATAMVKAFNNIDERFYHATRVENKIILVSKFGGTRFNDIIIGRDTFLTGNHVEILSNTRGFTHPNITVFKFEGGTEESDSRVAVDIEAFDRFNKDGRYLKVLNKSGKFNTLQKIIKVSYYIDEPILNKNGDIIGYKDFDKLCTVNIKEGEIIFKDIYKNVHLHDLFKIQYGRFSIFPIRDMDFDFYSEEYSNKKELNLETDFYSEWGTSNSINTHEDIEDFYENKNFSTLQNVLKIEDESRDLESPDIKSEYDRLQENYIKELTVPSRIIPSINKWVYRNGLDTREQDYRLSSSSAFGITNFSPIKEEKERNTDYFTHEWYYLQKIPYYFGLYGSDKIKNSFSYFPYELDVTENGLLNLNEDYFSNYFTVDMLKRPILNTSGDIVIDENNIAIKKQLRYSLFENGNENDFATAFHRGIKVIAKERIENKIENNYNLQKIKLKKNNRFNNYKFSCVLIPHNGEYGDKPRKNVEIEFLENRKYKTITLIIYVKLNDILTESKYNDNNIIKINKNSFIDRTILYTLNSQFISSNIFHLNTNGTMDYADVELSGSIDMISGHSDFANNKIIGTDDISNDSTKFLEEILINKNGGYNNVIASSGSITREFEIENVISNNKFETSNIIGGNQPVGLSLADVKTGTYIYENGGYNYLQSRLNSLSYGYISELINKLSPEIKYTSILDDGTIENNLFIVELQSPNNIIKPNYLKSVNDKNKPVNFNLSSSIGYILDYQKQSNIQPIYRHSGFYQPKFLDVISFEDPYIIEEYSNSLFRESQIRKKLKNTNTQIKLDEDFSKLKNVFYHKINDNNSSSILELTKESAFKPLYPLIGEIAIDKQDIYMWKSNWDASYFKKYISKTKTENIIGTRSTLEKKSFFASKVMKILNEILVDTFNPIQARDEEELKDIGEKIQHPDNNDELTWYERNNQIIIDVYLEKRLIKKLSNSNIRNFFIKYIKPDLGYGLENTLEDDVISYIKLNILPRYTIGNIDFYVRKSKDENFNISYPIINSTLSNIQKINSGLIKSNDFNYTKISSRSNFNIRLIYNKTNGFKYSIAPSFKIIKK